MTCALEGPGRTGLHPVLGNDFMARMTNWFPKPGDVSYERHQEILESCVGQVLSKIAFSESGMMMLVFENGVEIEYSDGFCCSRIGSETGLGAIFKDKQVYR